MNIEQIFLENIVRIFAVILSVISFGIFIVSACNSRDILKEVFNHLFGLSTDDSESAEDPAPRLMSK